MLRRFISRYWLIIVAFLCFSAVYIPTQDRPEWPIVFHALRTVLKLGCLAAIVLSVICGVLSFLVVILIYGLPFVIVEDKAEVLGQKRGLVMSACLSLFLSSVGMVIVSAIILSSP